MKDKPFNGFSRETIIFLNDLKNNNNKQWFDENRERYNNFVLEPFKSLVKGLLPYMASMDPYIEINNSASKAISRINRDIRFSKDKSPYRSNMWLTFKRPSLDWKLCPCCFFELFPDFYRYGMGFYGVSKETMDNLREFIERKPSEFKKLVKPIESNPKFLIEGDKYKKILNKNISGELFDWYQRKNLYITCNRPIDDLLFSEALIDEIAQGLKDLIPMYDFLWKIKA